MSLVLLSTFSSKTYICLGAYKLNTMGVPLINRNPPYWYLVNIQNRLPWLKLAKSRADNQI